MNYKNKKAQIELVKAIVGVIVILSMVVIMIYLIKMVFLPE